MQRRSNSALTYEKYKAEGRGTGTYSRYRPWLRTQDVPSKGTRSRVPLLRFGRIFHLLSDGERKALLEFDWDPEVIEIREQYPLEPTETNKICRELEIRHPSFGGGDIVMTTDFLVTYKTAMGVSYTAYQVKYDQSDLKNTRTVDKLKIEERYWLQKEVAYQVLLSSELNSTFGENLERLYRWRNLEVGKEYLRLIYAFCKRALRQMKANDLLIPDNFPRENLEFPGSLWKVNAYHSVLILLGKKIWSGPIKEVPLAHIQLRELKERVGNA